MRFFGPFLSRGVSTRKRTSGEQRRMLIFIAGLLFLTANLPVSNGAYDEKQGAVFCSSNTCYTVHISKTKFSEANANCIKTDGNLVTIKSEKEAEVVHNLLLELAKKTPPKQPSKLWIGLKLNQCVIKHDLLKGFVWTTGDENTEKSQFSNWMSEPKSTCTREMCVSMLHANPIHNFKWVDSPCSSLSDGYICKYDIQGACQPLELGGPGIVEYDTPFSFKSSSLNLVPYASFAYVSCGHQKDGKRYSLMCKIVEVSGTTMYQWADPRSDKYPGALCVSEELGCDYNNGGCKHKCTKNAEKGSISCECEDGYVLAPDLVSCVLPNHCQSHQCEHHCVNHLHVHECTCSPGFVLAENKRNCLDIDECLDRPCNHTCANTVGSFQCHCPAGFISHGTQCLDVDECLKSACSHGCLNTYGSYLCSCNSGYTLDSNKKSCLDIDECINSPCAHSCENTPGSYTCTCPKGFKLSSDRISCLPELQNTNITPTGHGDKDPGPKNREMTSNGQRDMTNQPTPSSVFKASFTEKEDKRKDISSSTTSSETVSFSASSSVDQVVSDPQDGYSVVLLVSILCACGVVLVLLVVAGGFLCYRRRYAKNKETEKQSSATDKYCWVPESENKANNDYR